MSECEKVEGRHWTVVSDYGDEAIKYIEDLEEIAPLNWLPILVDIETTLKNKRFMTRKEYAEKLKEWEEREIGKLFESLTLGLNQEVITSLENIGIRAGFSIQKRIAERLVERLRQEGRKKDAKKLTKYLKENGILPSFNYRLALIIGSASVAAWFALDLTNSTILGIIPGPINLAKTISYMNATGLPWNKSLDLALHTDTWNYLSGIFGKETELSKAISIYNQLEGSKDPNVYNLVRFFLEDGKISSDEYNAISYYLRVRENLIPKDLLPYWPIEERGQLAYEFCRQLLADGKITEEEKNIAELMLNFRRPMISVRGIQAGILLDPYKDHDKDGFSTIEELLKDRNYLNPLETPLTNDSEVYAIFLAGGEGYGNEIPYIFNHLALKYGTCEDINWLCSL
jgi:hypothetical protein